MVKVKRPLRVFLSYASQDKPVVRELTQRLSTEGWIDPWLDEKKLLPGQDWRTTIEEAVTSADVVLFFLSNNSVAREGYVQKELRYAREIALEKPEDSIFLIPIRIDDCEVPRGLRFYQWADYFGDKKEESYKSLITALKLRYEQREKAELENLLTEKERYERAEIERLKLEKEKAEKLMREKAERESAEKKKREDTYDSRKENLEKISVWDYILAPFIAGAAILYKGVEAFNQKRIPPEKFTQIPMPYTAGNPIDPSINRHMFFGRSDIVKMITREIKEPSQKPSLLLYGRRRMGKTSALLNLGRFIRDFNIIHIFISAQDIKYRTDKDLIFNLIKQVVEKLKEAAFVERLFENQDHYLSENIYKENPVHVLSSFFQDCHAFLEENNYYCLFMFDEYELLGASISRDFFLQIRDTMQHKPRFVFLFAGSHMPNEVKNSNWIEVFMNVKVLPISFLDRKDSYKLLTDPVPSLKYTSQNLVNRILDITGCQPLLLQSMATEIITRLNSTESYIVDENVVNHAVEKTLDAWGFNFFSHLWENDCDSREDRELLRKVALKNSSIKKSSLLNYNSSLKKLKERDLLKIEGEYVKLTMPILARWIERENPEIH